MLRSLDQILMYDPQHEDRYTDVLDEHAIYHCYLQPPTQDKKPPKFVHSKKVLIIVLLSNDGHEDALYKMAERVSKNHFEFMHETR